MGGFQDILILLSFLIEVAVLFYLEMKAWRTLYTPLIFLMLPYVIVLLITVAISGHFGLVEFYYPSILLWSVGLLLFALPSYCLAFVLQKHDRPLNSSMAEVQMPKVMIYLGVFVVLLFLWRFRSVRGSYVVGSREFGDMLCGKGFWGHLRQLALPILMMSIYYVEKNKWWLWLIIIPIIIVAVLYQVLGWLIIPCLVGIILRLYTGKLKLKLSLLVYVVLGASVVFLGSYIISLVIVGEKDLDNEVLSFISRNFIHYLTSGTLGLSVDMERGFPDAGEFDILIVQLINLANQITGSDEILSPLNPLFYNTGFNYTNVRSFFGTIYINTDKITFVVYILFLSTAIYLMKLATIRFNNIYVYTAYFLECGALFMGWFETYFALLPVIEIPIICLLLGLLSKVCEPKSLIHDDVPQ